jgi:hypothetical protein
MADEETKQETTGPGRAAAAKPALPSALTYGTTAWQITGALFVLVIALWIVALAIT